MTNTPVLIGTSKAGVDWFYYPDRHTLAGLGRMLRRLQFFGGIPTPEALALVGRAPKVVIVKLTSTQSDRLSEMLPPALIAEEMTLLETRVKATPGTLDLILDYLDDDIAIDYVLSGGDAQTDEEIAFAERQVRRSMASLRRKIKAGIRRGQQSFEEE